MRLHELTETRAARLDALKAIAAKAEAEKRDLHDGERAAFDAGRGEIEKLDRDIRNAAFLAEAERRAHAEPIGDASAKRELRNYSLARAVLGAASGKLDGLEAEWHAELSRNREARGIMVPTAILLGEARAQTTNSDPAGGYLVPSQMMPVADRFRPALKVEALGATVMRDLVGEIDLPNLDGSGTAQWIDPETTAATTTSASFSKVTMSPLTVAGQYELSRRIMINATAAEPLLRRDLAAILAAAIDAAAINGTPSPIGILNTPSVTKVSTETYLSDTCANLIYDLNAADVPATSRGFLMSPKVARAAMKALDADHRVIPMQEIFHGERFEVSSNAPDTIGSGNDKSALIYGEWPELIVGYWSGVDLLANPYHSTVASKGGLLLHAFVDCDVAVRRASAFAYAEI